MLSTLKRCWSAFFIQRTLQRLEERLLDVLADLWALTERDRE